jgi:hypothetical protein
MKTRAALVVVLAALAAGAATALSNPDPPWREWTAQAPALRGPLYGMLWTKGRATLLRLDPLTLRVKAGRRLALGPNAWASAFSPDRSRLVVSNGRAGGVRIVDLARMKVVKTITSFGRPTLISWVAPNRLLWLEGYHVVAADPLKGRVLRRTSVDWTLLRSATVPGRLLLLFAPSSTLGPARLAVVDGDGGVRTVALARISAGFEPFGDAKKPGRQRRPGLAVDPAGNRAFVVGGGEPVAEINLATLEVRYPALTQSTSFPGRLRGWLEPAAAAKGLNGPDRRALWLGNDLLAVTGEDGHVTPNELGNPVFSSSAAGLTLVDTRTWRARTLDPVAAQARLAGRLLLAAGYGWDGTGRQFGTGLSLYRPDGTRAAHLFGAHPVMTAEVLGSRALVWDDLRPVVIDTASATVVGQLKSPVPDLLVGDTVFGE